MWLVLSEHSVSDGLIVLLSIVLERLSKIVIEKNKKGGFKPQQLLFLERILKATYRAMGSVF